MTSPRAVCYGTYLRPYNELSLQTHVHQISIMFCVAVEFHLYVHISTSRKESASALSHRFTKGQNLFVEAGVAPKVRL